MAPFVIIKILQMLNYLGRRIKSIKLSVSGHMSHILYQKYLGLEAEDGRNQ